MTSWPSSLEQRRDDRRVDAAGHGDDDPRRGRQSAARLRAQCRARCHGRAWMTAHSLNPHILLPYAAAHPARRIWRHGGGTIKAKTAAQGPAIDRLNARARQAVRQSCASHP